MKKFINMETDTSACDQSEVGIKLPNQGSEVEVERIAEYFFHRRQNMKDFKFRAQHEKFNNATYRRFSTQTMDENPRFTSTLQMPQGLRLKDIELMVPNMRDIAISSGLPNMKQGVLYRSARPFAHNAWRLRMVLVEAFNIKSMIDLRDDNLESFPDEHASRMIISQSFRYSIPQKISPQGNDPNVFVAPERSVRHAHNLHQQQMSLDRETSRKIRQTMRQLQNDTASSSSSHPNTSSRLAACSRAKEMEQVFFKDRSERSFYVLNVMETDAMKQKIMSQVMQSGYLPLLGAARVADKVAGTALAPFYFCRFMVAGHKLEESYFELLDLCAERWGECLKLLTRCDLPCMFHCSLGKDRTGLLAAFVLHILGATEAMINFDYNLTEFADQAYHLYVHRFIVEESGLPDDFCGAPGKTVVFASYSGGNQGDVVVDQGPLWKHQ